VKQSLTSTALILFLAATANGDVIFNSFGPGHTYDQTNAFTISGPASSTGQTFESAARFTALTSGPISQVDLGLTLRDGGAVNVFLYGDASGSPDNLSQILLGSVTPTVAFGTTNNAIVSLVPTGTVMVTQSVPYWLVLKPANDTVRETWNRSLGVVGIQDVSLDDMNWIQANTTIAAFEITSVPESSTATIAFLALFFLVGRQLLKLGVRAKS
jgi:hypothetical protein